MYQVALPVPDEAEFLSTLLQWINNEAASDIQRDAIIHVLASVVNKRAEGAPTVLTNTCPS